MPHCLALCFQDPDIHHFFIPGEKWLVCTLSTKSLKGAVSLADVIGVSSEDFEEVYGTKWKTKVRNGLHPFSFFCTHHNRDRDYITVRVSNPNDEYGSDESITPGVKTIVQDVIDSRTIKKLAAAIENASQLHNTTIHVKEGSKPAAVMNKPSVHISVSKEPATPAAALPTTEACSTTPSAPPAPHTPSVARVADMADTAASVTPTAPSPIMSTEELLVKIVDDLKGLNLSNEKDFDKAFEKVCHHAGFELMTYLDNAQDSTPKGEVYLSKSTGGTPANYIKCHRPSQGGSSNRTVQWIMKHAKKGLNDATEGLHDGAKDKVINTIYSDSVSNPLFKYIGHS